MRRGPSVIQNLYVNMMRLKFSVCEYDAIKIVTTRLEKNYKGHKSAAILPDLDLNERAWWNDLSLKNDRYPGN